MITVSWENLAMTPVRKEVLLPEHAYNIHLEYGGWTSRDGIYLWWCEYGNDKCKKIVATKWLINLNRVRKSFKVSDAKTQTP